MTEHFETYDGAKDRLDALVGEVRKKDISLEASLDLLEEGVALANRCTELIDQAISDQFPVTDDDSPQSEEGLIIEHGNPLAQTSEDQ